MPVKTSGARLVILPGVGHYLPTEVYPQVAAVVRALAHRRHRAIADRRGVRRAF